MVDDKKNKYLWERLHTESRFLVRYPHERLIQFVFGNFSRDKASDFKILDYGGGAGRHTVFLSENKFKTYACDISETGLKFTEKILKEKKLKADLKIISGDKLDYPDNYFDSIVSFAVLYLLSSRQLDKIIPDIYRILKKNGKIFMVLRSTKDYRIKHAKLVGNGDYTIVGDKKTRVNNENKMLMHFFSKKEIEKRFSIFKKVCIDEMVNTYDNGKIIDHDYIVQLEK